MPKSHRYALILAGGRGTRFWPRSRRLTPKQLQPIITSRTLLRETIERLRPMVPPERMWVLTSTALRASVRREAPEIPARQILAEPVARNTAPCIGLAAHIIQQLDPDAVLGVFPADHHIERPAAFRRVANAAFRAATKRRLVVLGIEPQWPETGYGYIELPAPVRPGQLDPIAVKRFREKPKPTIAKRYLKAKRYYWNSGMFFWRADVFLESLRKHAPQTAALLASLPQWGTRGFNASLCETFPKITGISVDYAVLEKSNNIMAIAAGDIGWNDLGSWNAVYAMLAKKEKDNVARTDALLVASEGNFVDVPGRLVAVVGLSDVVVVETKDALLVADRRRAQQVGEVVKLLEMLKRDDLL